MIYYVIQSAHPDYKRPHVNNYFNSCDHSKLTECILDHYSNFIYERIYEKYSNDEIKQNGIKIINDFLDNYFDEYFMANEVWNAMAVIDGDWFNVTPSVIQVYDHLIKQIDD